MTGAIVMVAAAVGTPNETVELNAVSISVPALDGLRGLAAGYERWIPAWRISLLGLGQLRQTASGDFGATSTGVGAELRWYWNRDGWLSHLPAGSMVGWWLGARVEIAVNAIRDRVDDRWLGTGAELGASALIGYRLAPWRGLEITPSIGIGVRSQHDLSGRLSGHATRTVALGCTVGWMF